MFSNFPRFYLVFALSLSSGSLAACAGFGALSIYRAEIVQGNVITREQVALVKPGMSRDQVRDILGSPMVADIFHAHRWDYVFTIRREGAPPQQRNVVALFEGDRLLSLNAPDLPSEREFVASIDTVKPSKSLPVLELTSEQIKALPVRVAPPSQDRQVPQGALRNYPPLESR